MFCSSGMEFLVNLYRKLILSSVASVITYSEELQKPLKSTEQFRKQINFIATVCKMLAKFFGLFYRVQVLFYLLLYQKGLEQKLMVVLSALSGYVSG